MFRSLGSLLFVFPLLLPADVIVDSSLSLTQLQITTSGNYTVAISGVTASAFNSVFDGVTNSCSATGALTGICYGYDPGPGTASVTAAQGAANASADANAGSLTADAASHVNIPGNLIDTAGTNAAGPYGDLSGTLQVVDSSNSGQTPVTVNFSGALSGNQDLSMDSNGLFASSEVIFNFLLTGMFTNGFSQTTELFLDSPLSLSSAGFVVNPLSKTLAISDNTLLTNTPYSFDAQVDAESFGAGTPEPSFLGPTALAVAALLLSRGVRRGNRSEIL